MRELRKPKHALFYLPNSDREYSVETGSIKLVVQGTML